RPPLTTCHLSGRFFVGEESRSTRSSALTMIACTAIAEQAKRRVPWVVVRNSWGVDIAVLRALRLCVNKLPSCQGGTCATGRRMARQSHGAPVVGGMFQPPPLCC